MKLNFHGTSAHLRWTKNVTIFTRVSLNESLLTPSMRAELTMHPIRSESVARGAKTPIDRSTGSDALRKACRATRPRISSANYLIKRRWSSAPELTASCTYAAAGRSKGLLLAQRSRGVAMPLRSALCPGPAHCIQMPWAR